MKAAEKLMLHTMSRRAKNADSHSCLHPTNNPRSKALATERSPLTAMQSAYGNQVMLRLLGYAAESAVTPGLLLRKCACGDSGGECAECKKKDPENGLHRKALPGNNGVSQIPPIVHDVLRAPGRPLDAGTRNFMEARFGRDFKGVRIHTDDRAAESAEAVNAIAYTVGRNIVFGRNAYSTGAQSRQLLAHELAHVVQQGNQVMSASAPQSIVSPASAVEREAETVGASIGHGRVMPTQSASPCGLMRLGANPGCSANEARSIHQGIFDARGWLDKAIPRLESKPLDTQVLAGLRRNFGPTFGVAANAQLIHDRLVAARNAVGSIPYSCARAPADATCAAGHCGYTPGAGSHQATICADVSLKATTSSVFRAGCVLHESFHATFARMGVDFYSGWHAHSSSTAGYPGTGLDPLLNADSYTSLVMDLS